MPKAENFPVTEHALACLKDHSPQMALAIEHIGPIRRSVHPNIFQGLLHAISGQQISGLAHQAIWNRFCAAFNLYDYDSIAKADLDSIRQCGLSQAKASAIRNVAALFADGSLQETELRNLPDQQLRNILAKIKGIGPWTIDMVLIFALKRPDIFSLRDLGIQRGLRILYQLETLTPATVPNFSPYGTIASFYLWEIAGGQYAPWPDRVSAIKGNKKN